MDCWQWAQEKGESFGNGERGKGIEIIENTCYLYGFFCVYSRTISETKIFKKISNELHNVKHIVSLTWYTQWTLLQCLINYWPSSLEQACLDQLCQMMWDLKQLHWFIDILSTCSNMLCPFVANLNRNRFLWV